MLQFVKNEADHDGRSSRSPVMLFDIQDNNNVNSFAVRLGEKAFSVLMVLYVQSEMVVYVTL